MKAGINLYNNSSALTGALADKFHRHIAALCSMKNKVAIALSGGNTPLQLFRRIASLQPAGSASRDWNKVHFFWCDERCVPPQHPESNFGMANRYLLRPLQICESNMHRIRGENKPEEEVLRYSEEIRQHVPMKNGLPVFDWIFLGMGDDGHTASIFPGELPLLYADAICAVAMHPLSRQQRITLTGKTINNADLITFMVTGRSKSKTIKDIMDDEPAAKRYPARYIKPLHGKLEWYIEYGDKGQGTRDK